jgi:NAD(P)H-hydrate repair Nnr-like enzyme with NAD(P)H-hydrate dehydratase domain
MPAASAAAAAVFIHGMAAQKCSFSLLAEDIDRHIATVIEEIRSS